MKRWLAMLMACMLLLSGCGGAKTPAPELPTGEPVQAPVEEPVTEQSALAEFREKLPTGNTRVAAIYLGYAYLTGYDDLTVYLESNGFYEMYPILSEITREQFVQQEGGEIYLLVPAAEDTALTVSGCVVDETAYEAVRGEELLALGAGQPVLLLGNMSEIVPNLWVSVRTAGGEELEFAPSLSLMDGKMTQFDGVYDCSDYEYLQDIWDWMGEPENPEFCGTWYGRAADGDGYTSAMKLSLWTDGYVEYSYGVPEGEVLEFFEGSWYEENGVITLEMHGGPVSYDGSYAPDYAYDSVCTFEWGYQGEFFYLRHIDGNVLLYGTEGKTFEFLPFDSYLLAVSWSVDAPVWGWTYDLSLMENGECRFTVSDAEDELVRYEGWWNMSGNYYVWLDMKRVSGRHPESAETEYISGTYFAEKDGNFMKFSFDSGGILTIGMEEDGFETFVLADDNNVSVCYAQDVPVNWDEYEWVIVDDTVPVEAAFFVMAPVTDFTVMSLFMNGTEFEVTELYNYGTLTPEAPLRVTLTVYGSIPSYGVSWTDANGIYRLRGIGLSGMDGSLELIEIQ